MTRDNWPSDVYIPSWKEFRVSSNENKVTAEAIIASDCWPISNGIRVLDVGCGDGLLLKCLLNSAPKNQISGVCLVDPDKELLSDAQKLFGDTYREFCDFKFVRGSIGDAGISDLAKSYDVVLVAHVVYLIENKEDFIVFLNSVSHGAPIYVVIDDPKSIFTSLWKRTAPQFHDRVIQYHDLIKNLSKREFCVEAFPIVSMLENPYDKHPGARDSILSHLTYSNYTEAETNEQRFVLETVESRLTPSGISCKSTCYTIKRI